MRYIYSALIFLLLPLLFFKLWRGGKNIPTNQNRWQERVGVLPKNITSNLLALKTSKTTNEKTRIEKKPLLWIHAASVGELIAARPLIDHYLNTQQWNLCITTMTATGSAEVLKHYQGKVIHAYAPFDLGLFIALFLKKVKPSAYLIIETELWPNTIHHCKKRNIPVILVNARLSEKSARGYKKFSVLTHKMLNDITHVIAQAANDSQRFYALGLTKEKCSVSGSIKFDLNIPQETQEQAQDLKSKLSEQGKHALLIAASTHQGEDELILSAFQTLQKTHNNARLIIVPRHPKRFDTVFSLCNKQGFNTVKFSEKSQTYPDNTQILLGDTMGELLVLLGAADIAFIGGSLINNGGHNYIEPAAWGIPILSGPSRYNFQQISDLLMAESALTIVKSHNDLSLEWERLINDKALRLNRGLAAKKVAENNRGSLEKAIRVIDQALTYKVKL